MPVPDDLAALPTADLKAELARSLEVSAHHLVRLAAIVRVLEDRGEDLSDLKLGLLGHLRRIAYGQVLPEIVVQYAESPALLRRLEALPIPDQRRLAAGEPVRLVVWGPDGRADHRLVHPLQLTRSQVPQVFGPRGIRDEAEQVLLLEERRGEARETRRRATARVGRLTVDRRDGTLRFGRSRVTQAEVLAALAELRGGADAPADGDDPADEASLPVRLSRAEHQRVRQCALDGQTTANALIRRALAIAGLIGTPPSEETRP